MNLQAKSSSVIRHVAFASVFAASVHAQITAPTFALTPEMRIDGANEDLIPFTSILVGRNGQIVIPQNRDAKFLFYDASGKRTAAVGRPGSGPGEFAPGPALGLFMGWVADSVWIYESQARRATWLAPDGTFLRNWAAVLEAPDPKLVVAGRLGFVPSSFYADGSMLTIDRESAAPDAVAMYVVISKRGALVRPLLKFPRPERQSIVSLTTSDGTRASVTIPFANPSVAGFSRDGLRVGLVTVSERAFHLTVMRPGGDTLLSRSYAFTPTAIPERVIDSIITAAKTPRLPPSLHGEAATAIRQNLPRNYPPVVTGGLMFGVDETTWVALAPGSPSGRTLLALDATGAPIGRLELRPNQALGAASRTHVWLIERDADDLPSVVRYRIAVK